MGASPTYKIYTADNQYIASAINPFFAAMVVAGVGNEGTTIRYGHSKKAILWNEGHESIPASESYDTVNDVCIARVRALSQRFTGKVG